LQYIQQKEQRQHKLALCIQYKQNIKKAIEQRITLLFPLGERREGPIAMDVTRVAVLLNSEQCVEGFYPVICVLTAEGV